MLNIQGEIPGKIKACPAFWCGFHVVDMLEVHVASDVIDLFYHFPYVFSPSRKTNSSQKAASHFCLRLIRKENTSYGRSREWEHGCKSFC